MDINKAEGIVTFDNLVSSSREFGSEERIQVVSPAEKAVATNAKGVFCQRPLEDIHTSAKTTAQTLVAELTA